MRRFALYCAYLPLVLVLAWALPALYDAALIKPIDKTHLFYSPTLKAFIYTEQLRSNEAEAAGVEDHHADIVYKDEHGIRYDRSAFEAALPFVYFRNMELRGLLPLELEGRRFDRRAVEAARRVLELRARDLDGRRPPRDLLPLIEADPGQAALLYPADRFRLTAAGMEFVNADHNAVDEALTARFTEALTAAGFRFPARRTGGNFTTFKPYEGGLFLVDADGGLFHLVRRRDLPEVRIVPLPDGVIPRHVLVSESRDGPWLGLMLDEQNGLHLIRRDSLDFVSLDLPTYAPDTMDCKLIFDPLYLTAVISDAARVHGAAFRLSDADAAPNRLTPFRTFSHHMSRDRDAPQRAAAERLFPFRVRFAREDTTLYAPRLELSPAWATGALPLCLCMALGYAVWSRRRPSEDRYAEIGLILGCGVFGLIAILLLREECRSSSALP